METISQRELRNNSAEVIRGLARGHTYRLTNHGVEVGVLMPAESTPLDGLILRRGTQKMEFPPGVVIAESTGDILRELRSDR